MKKNILLFIVVFISISCYAQKENNKKWDFNNLDGWVYAHQDDNPSHQCELEDGILKIFARAQSWDRKKIKTVYQKYTTGRYTWKTYIPPMGKKDQASVGSWIYCDDHHELDFEVGYGTTEVRAKMNAAPDEMIAYMTSQDFPFTSVPHKIKVGWHLFEIDLTIKKNKYYISWLIDKKVTHEIQLQFGTEISFHIFCSVENLKFIGDQIPQQENYGLFDFVEYKYHK